jgi:hypothetical protein
MDTATAVELPTATTDFCVFLTMITTTDGAWLYTDRADGRAVEMACGQVVRAEVMAALHLHA